MVETNFKQTEIGLIPEDWEIRELGELGDVKMCKRIFQNQTTEFGDIPFFKIGTFGKEPDAYISRKQFEEFKYKFSYPRKGDILISAAGTIGRTVVYNGEESYFQDSNIVWINNTESVVSNKFLKFVLSVVNYNTEGGTIQRLYNSILKSTKFTCPPFPEQEAILNSLSDADAWIENLEKLIAKKRLIKQGAMQELLTPKENGEVKKLGEICKVVGGGTPSTFNEYFWNGNIQWFTPTEVGYTKYLNDSKRKISLDGLKNSSATILPVGAILMTTRAGIGDLGILNIEACTNQGFQSLISNDGISNEFLYYLMSTKKNELLQNASGSTFLEISPNKVKSIEVSIPQYGEQTKIANILSDMDTEIDALEYKLQKAQQIKQGMMQQLLTGKIRLIKKEQEVAI